MGRLSRIAAARGLGVLLVLAGIPGARAEDLNVEGEVTSFLAHDRDGDGLKEIWVSYHRDGQRYLGVFQGKAAYSKTPDRVIGVDPRAVAYVVGELDPSPGLDLVFLSRTSGALYSWTPSDGGGDYRRLFDADLFFTQPSRKGMPAWLSAQKLDVDGDGTEDLVLPERRQLRIRFGSGREASLPVAYYLLTDGRSDKISAVLEDFVEEDKSPPPILDSTCAFPYPLFLDFDGDGLLDVIVKQQGHRLEVYRQTAPGAFSAAADFSIAIPWTKEATSLRFLDVNGDRKADMVECELLLKDLATEVKVYTQDPSREDRGFREARQALRVQGFFRRPEFADVNADGRLDLLVATYRVDLIEKLKSSTVDELEMTFEVFLGAAETPFERRPSFQRKFLLRTKDLQGNSSPTLFASHDLTGDGRPDVLLLDHASSLRLFRGRAGGVVGFDEEASFAEKIEDPASVRIEDLDGRPGDELILRYERRLEVHRVR